MNKPDPTVQYLTRIQQQNDAFLAMTPLEKRVAIAQDVLELMATQVTQVMSGCYLAGKNLYLPKTGACQFGTPEGLRILQETECRTCAKGTLFLATVLRGPPGRSAQSIYRSCEADMDAELVDQGIFDRSTWDQIECAFEGAWIQAEQAGQKQLRDDCLRFHHHFADNEDTRGSSPGLMVAICLNLIHHGGEFVPTWYPETQDVLAAVDP